MSELTTRDHELVALGAAVGSNCVPCVEHHVPAARKAGLTDAQIRAAIDVADQVRRVPARKVLEAAKQALGDVSARGADGACESVGCGDLGNRRSATCG